jgi:hypothetical protein
VATDRAIIENNLRAIRQRMADAALRAARRPEDVRLVAITKTVGIAEIAILHELGVKEMGENRVAGALPKIEKLPKNIHWHMIGNVQRRKARDVVALFDQLDALDRLVLADALEKTCKDVGKKLRILVEVNVSGEASKHGFEAEELPRALDYLSSLDNLAVEGLMTMAPFSNDPEQSRPMFARLRTLAEANGLRELSMGMSSDFEVAIEEGATQVRIGTALFELPQV